MPNPPAHASTHRHSSLLATAAYRRRSNKYKNTRAPAQPRVNPTSPPFHVIPPVPPSARPLVPSMNHEFKKNVHTRSRKRTHPSITLQYCTSIVGMRIIPGTRLGY